MKNKDYTVYTVCCVFIGVLFTIVCLLAMILLIKNNSNRITEGTIIDKTYSSAYISTEYTEEQESPVYINHPPQYMICIEGYQNGDKVQYWRVCTEYEYDTYNIGDWYGHEQSK